MLDSRKQIALLFMINVFVSTLTIIIFIITGFIMIRSRPQNSFVQLVDGQTITVTTTDSYKRQPQTIRKFVTDVFSLIFTWNGYLPQESNRPNQAPLVDLGIPVTGGKRVPTVTMYGSFAFNEKTRNLILQQIALLAPQDLFKPVTPNQPNRKPRVLILVEFVGDPQPVGKGMWDLEFVSSLVIFEPSAPQGRLLTPFNKMVRVRAIEPMSKILYNPVKSNEDIATNTNENNAEATEEPIYIYLDKIIQNIRQSGLQIVELKDL